MPQNAAEPEQEIKRLQRCMSDLVSVLALPAALNDSEPSRILKTFLDALLKLVDLDFAYAQTRVAYPEVTIEVLRISDSNELSQDEIRDALTQWSVEDIPDPLPAIRRSIGDREISILSLQLGIESGFGPIVVGCQRLDFPKQTERLVINVAANQVAVMLQQAQLLGKQKRVARDLDERVAQRTEELASANQELRKEIADRKRAQDELKRSEEKYRVVVETASDAVISMDESGVIIFANAATTGIFGHETAELIGKPLAMLMPKALQKLHETGYKRYLETGERHLNWRGSELIAQRADAEEFPVEVSFGEMTADGQRIFTGFIRDISEKKRAEEAVLASEGNLRLIINTMPVQAWSAQPDGSVDFFNQRWLNYTGLSPTQAQGWGWGQAFHPDDVSRVTAYWQSMMATGESGEIEARLRRFDGDYRWFIIRADRLCDESGAIIKWYGTNTDIDDRRRAEEAVQERELNLRQITETIPEMLWSAAPDGAIDYCNGRLLDYTGLRAEEVLHGGWMRLLHPDDVDPAVQAWRSSTATGSPFRIEVRTFHAADQAYRWCVTSALPLLDEGGRIVKWHGTVVDMHDWKKAQEEIRNTQAELAKMMRVTTIGQLTASIAHEVNQPLSGIITNANTSIRMLDSSPPNIDGARETARRTLRDGNRASEVIARLRTLFDKKEVVAEVMDLNEAVREVIALLQSELQSSGVILRHEFAGSLPAIKGDRVQLQQVILNLLRNAADAMSGVANRPRQLLITTQLEGEQVRLSVVDSGVGFDPEVADRLFDSFFTTKEDGMGIGLAVSRSIIEAHHGRLWATANHGPGATFAFLIPCDIHQSGNERGLQVPM